MKKGIFITGTGTDIGKTYTSGLLMKALLNEDLKVHYYKPISSGTTLFEKSDAGYVTQYANLQSAPHEVSTYRFEAPYSPHLAAGLSCTKIDINQLETVYHKNCDQSDFMVVEGCGGLICPLIHTPTSTYMQTDLMKRFNLPLVVVADAGLGTINACVLTASMIKALRLPVLGFIFNRYNDSYLHRDNLQMVELLTGLPVLGKISDNGSTIDFLKSSIKEALCL